MKFSIEMKKRFSDRLYTRLYLVQFRFPKSKKKRIRRKWSNRPENYRKRTWVRSPIENYPEIGYLSELINRHGIDEHSMAREYYNYPIVEPIEDKIHEDKRIDVPEREKGLEPVDLYCSRVPMNWHPSDALDNYLRERFFGGNDDFLVNNFG